MLVPPHWPLRLPFSQSLFKALPNLTIFGAVARTFFLHSYRIAKKRTSNFCIRSIFSLTRIATSVQRTGLCQAVPDVNSGEMTRKQSLPTIGSSMRHVWSFSVTWQSSGSVDLQALWQPATLAIPDPPVTPVADEPRHALSVRAGRHRVEPKRKEVKR